MARVTYKEVSPIDWDTLVVQSPQGTIFSTTRWMSLFDTPYKLWGVYKGAELIGGWGGFLTLQPLTPFQGILIKEPKEMSYVSIMSRHIEVTKNLIPVLPKEFYNSYGYTDIRPFKWYGKWKTDIKYTYMVDLRDMGKLWKELDKDTRNSIVSSDGGRICSLYDIKKFLPLYHQVFEKKGLSIPVTDEFLMKFALKFEPVIMGCGDTIAIAMKDRKRAYYILGASIGEGLTPYVLWNLFQYIAKDVPEIDLCGANDEKIAFYKRGMGGKLTSYLGVKRGR